MDVTDNHIALIETSKRFPSISTLELLASALEVDVLELFSIKSIELSNKKNVKDAILADIDRILTAKLLEEEQ